MSLVVAQVIDDLSQGGAQTLLRDIIDRSPPSVSHRVYTLGRDDTLRSELEEVAMSVTVCDGAFRFDPRALASLSRGLTGNIDVVHAHLPYAQAFGRLFAKLSRVGPVVSTYHDVPQSFCPDPQMLAVEVVTRPLDDATVGVSEGVVEEFERGRYFSRFGDMCAIPNGVDVANIRERVADTDARSVRVDLGVDAEETLFLNVGRLASKKRQADLVAATRLLRDRDQSVHLVLVGEGDQEATIRERIRSEGVSEAVTITGHVPKVEPYYGAADAYVHAALHEGFGLTIAEAMAAGLPVIATDVPGARDMVGDSGILVPPQSPTALADAMSEYLDTDYRAKLASRGMIRIDQFDIAHTERAYRGLYRSLLRG